MQRSGFILLISKLIILNEMIKKTLISIVALDFFAVTSVLSMPEARVNAVEVTQAYGVDKEKCTEDYICYNRVGPAYCNINDMISEGMSEFESSTTDYMSKSLCAMVQKLWSSSGCTYPSYDLTTGESTKNCFNEYRFGDGDWSTYFIASLDWKRERIYQAALQKRPVKVPLPYSVTTFYPQGDDHSNGRYTRRSKQLEIIMIYENGDWFIDDIIYSNKKTLRSTLKSMLATAR